MIYALQVGATGWQKEQAIGAVLLGSFGPELSAVKNALDQGAIARHDHYDLGQLIYCDIDDAGQPDAEWPIGGAGAASAPDAQVDSGQVDPGPDWGVAGDGVQPDAAVDKPDMIPTPGFAPQPDA